MQKTKKLTWIQGPHPIWGRGGREENIHALKLHLTFPKWQWEDQNKRFSIVGPASVLWTQKGECYELFDRKTRQVVGQWRALQAAKNAAQNL